LDDRELKNDRLGARLQVEAIADEVLTAYDRRRQISPFSKRLTDFNLGIAYEVTAAVRNKRKARGERPVGRKVGFTNRNMWSEYGVHAPIWGDMYDTTVRDLPTGGEGFDLDPFVESRIEPEIAFGLARAPEPDMDDTTLLSCIDWVAHGFEIVQSIFPNWHFEAADTVAAFGLHGALLLGPRHSIHTGDATPWFGALANFEITLECDGELVELGHATHVLGGPLPALRHLAELLTRDSVNPPLAATEIVTTGTLTLAQAAAPHEHWRTTISGLPIDGIAVHFD